MLQDISIGLSPLYFGKPALLTLMCVVFTKPLQEDVDTKHRLQRYSKSVVLVTLVLLNKKFLGWTLVALTIANSDYPFACDVVSYWSLMTVTSAVGFTERMKESTSAVDCQPDHLLWHWDRCSSIADREYLLVDR